MLSFLMHFRTAWSDFFPSTSSNNLNSQAITSRKDLSGTGVYVSNCLFRDITSSSNGGALYCGSATYILVESTSFFSCKTSQYGGAIYISISGQSVLHKVCGYDCNSTSNYCQFAHIQVNSDVSYKNNINYSSFVCCVGQSSNSWHIFRFYYGKICFPSVNVSLNKCNGRAIYCCPTVDSSSITCSFTYSSFADNIFTVRTCFCFDTGGANYGIKSCNILRNTQGSLDLEGTIYTFGNLMIEDSCILENKATYIFRQGSSYTITLSNCTVDSTSNNGYLTTRNTVTKSFILALNHMSTRNCHSEYDSAGTLTPIIQSPSSSKKQKYCSCPRFIYQHRLEYMFFLTSILFSFIHPKPFSYP
jgi:hypothetical protein